MSPGGIHLVANCFCSRNCLGSKRNSFSQPYRKCLPLIMMEKTLVHPIYLPNISGTELVWLTVNISIYSKYLHIYIFRRKMSISWAFRIRASRQATWETVQTYIWKEKQRNLLLPIQALTMSVESLSSDNLLIGHLPWKFKLVTSLDLFQYNRKKIFKITL